MDNREPVSGQLNDEPDEAPEEDDALAQRGAHVATLGGRIVLRAPAPDPQAADLQPGNRGPIRPTASAIEKVVIEALEAQGYAATVELTFTDG